MKIPIESKRRYALQINKIELGIVDNFSVKAI